jgi:hypothetical protein
MSLVIPSFQIPISFPLNWPLFSQWPQWKYDAHQESILNKLISTLGSHQGRGWSCPHFHISPFPSLADCIMSSMLVGWGMEGQKSPHGKETGKPNQWNVWVWRPGCQGEWDSRFCYYCPARQWFFSPFLFCSPLLSFPELWRKHPCVTVPALRMPEFHHDGECLWKIR